MLLLPFGANDQPQWASKVTNAFVALPAQKIISISMDGSHVTPILIQVLIWFQLVRGSAVAVLLSPLQLTILSPSAVVQWQTITTIINELYTFQPSNSCLDNLNPNMSDFLDNDHAVPKLLIITLIADTALKGKQWYSAALSDRIVRPLINSPHKL